MRRLLTSACIFSFLLSFSPAQERVDPVRSDGKDGPFILLPALPPPAKPFEPRVVPPAPPAPFVPGRIAPKRTAPNVQIEVDDLPALVPNADQKPPQKAVDAKGFFHVQVENGATYVLGSKRSVAALNQGKLPPSRQIFVRQSPTGGDVVFEDDIQQPKMLPRLIKAYNKRFATTLGDHSPTYRVLEPPQRTSSSSSTSGAGRFGLGGG